MHQIDRVKRHITRGRWNAIRLAFERVVQYQHLAQKDKKQVPYHDAARHVLYDLLAPLTEQEKKQVRAAINRMTIVDNLEAAADVLLFDLHTSL
jgi:hypothetical protein